jgi:HAD superfamily hydrolase (TIGR01509 family)
VAEQIGVTASDRELRSAYRTGMGAAFRAIGNRPAYLHRALFGAAYSAMAEALGGQLDEEAADAVVDRQYAATLKAAALRPDCADTLNALRELGVTLQIVSNIDDEQLYGLVAALGLRGLLDELTSSESAGSCKPDPGIYRFALSKARCEPAEVLFVGDTLQHDIAGPATMGMRTAWLTSNAKRQDFDIRPDFVIHALAELPALVRPAGGPS